MYINFNYTLEFGICTKISNCLNFIQKRKLFFFCLIKLLLIKARYPIKVNVSLEAILEGQGW